MTKCNCCGGTFNPIQADGSAYYHACGPIANPAYQPNPVVALFNLVQTIERPGKVDQNIASINPKTGATTLVSPGLGVTAL